LQGKNRTEEKDLLEGKGILNLAGGRLKPAEVSRGHFVFNGMKKM